ncbi:MAG: hypothetical protein JSS21_02860 [Proteobacteria bacterium]|nr:hypothetical protein [Pseudomonadota bacterium]
MRVSHVVTAVVCLIVGVVVGAAGMWAFRTHADHVVRASVQPVPATASSSAQPDILQTKWNAQSNSNPITGKVSWFVAGISRESATVLYVSCSHDAQKFDVFVYGEGLYPGQDISDISSNDYYRVDYRFDNRPGVTNELWKGTERSAHATNPSQFINSLQSSQKLVMQFSSTVMDVSSAAAQYQHFDLQGFDAAFKNLVPHCNANK